MALPISQNIFSNTNSHHQPTFQVTVFQAASTNPQANARVRVYDNNNNQVETAITNHSGIVSWPWTHPIGEYKIIAGYAGQPNDAQTGQRVVTCSGANVVTTVTLGDVYQP